MSVAKKTSKKNTAVKAVKAEAVKAVKAEAVKAEAVKAEAVKAVVEKSISNTQKCANMILALAQDAKHTRQEIVESVANAISALSIVTVKTMISDLQNSKYAKRYSTHTISIDKSTKIVTVASEIV